jgi:predicted transglutaminase-like cysteine proteinase
LLVLRFGCGFVFAMICYAGSVFAASDHVETAMQTGQTTSQPVGHYEFCKANSQECNRRSTDLTPVALTDGQRATLIKINADVNARVAPMTDQDHYGKAEVWTYPDDQGDCEDYALEKQRILLGMGLPASTLLITVLRKPDGEGHAVLTVRTDRGDYLLDNLDPDVKLWSATNYTFLKRQSEQDSGKWVAIAAHDENQMAAAVR